MHPLFVPLYSSSSGHIRRTNANLPLGGSFVATYTNATSVTQGTESTMKGKRHPKLVARPVKATTTYAACGKQGERMRDKNGAHAMSWVLIAAKDMCLACRLFLDAIRRYHLTQSNVLFGKLWLVECGIQHPSAKCLRMRSRRIFVKWRCGKLTRALVSIHTCPSPCPNPTIIPIIPEVPSAWRFQPSLLGWNKPAGALHLTRCRPAPASRTTIHKNKDVFDGAGRGRRKGRTRKV